MCKVTWRRVVRERTISEPKNVLSAPSVFDAGTITVRKRRDEPIIPIGERKKSQFISKLYGSSCLYPYTRFLCKFSRCTPCTINNRGTFPILKSTKRITVIAQIYIYIYTRTRRVGIVAENFLISSVPRVRLSNAFFSILSAPEI